MAEINDSAGGSGPISNVFELSSYDSDLTLTDSSFYNTIETTANNIIDSAELGRLGSLLSDTRWL